MPKNLLDQKTYIRCVAEGGTVIPKLVSARDLIQRYPHRSLKPEEQESLGWLLQMQYDDTDGIWMSGRENHPAPPGSYITLRRELILRLHETT